MLRAYLAVTALLLGNACYDGLLVGHYLGAGTCHGPAAWSLRGDEVQEACWSWAHHSSPCSRASFACPVMAMLDDHASCTTELGDLS